MASLQIKQVANLAHTLSSKIDTSTLTATNLVVVSSDISISSTVQVNPGTILGRPNSGTLSALTAGQVKAILAMTAGDLAIGNGNMIVGGVNNTGVETTRYSIPLAGFSLSPSTIPVGSTAGIATETVLSSIPVTSLGKPTSNFDFNNNKGINLNAPSNNGDAVNLSYINTTFSGVMRIRGDVTNLAGATQFDSLGGYTTSLVNGDVFKISNNGTIQTSTFLTAFGLLPGLVVATGNLILFDGTEFNLVGSDISISGVSVPTKLSQLVNDENFISSAQNLFGDLSGQVSNALVVGINNIPVTYSGLTSGQLLGYNGTAFINVNAPNTGLVLTGDVSGSGTGTINISLVTLSGIYTGSYSNLSINNKGLVTGARALNASDINTALSYVPGTLTANQVVTVTGDASGSGSTAINLALNTIAGLVTYTGTNIVTTATFSNIVVSNKGLVVGARALSAADINTALTYTAYNAAVNTLGFLTSNQPLTITGDVIGTGSTNITLALNTIAGLTSGTYSNIIVSNKGQVTVARAINTADITTALGFTPGTLNANQLISVTGDVKGTGNTSITLALNTIAGLVTYTGTAIVTTQTYDNITVSNKGLITALRTLNSSDIVNAIGYTAYNGATNSNNYLVANQAITVSGDATGSGQTAIALTLNTVAGLVTGVGTSQTYSNLTVSNKGLLVGIRVLNEADITTALGFTPGNQSGNQPITVSGDAVGLGSTAITLVLNTISGLVTGAGTSQTYNNITVSNKGQVIAIRVLSASDINTALNYTAYNGATNSNNYLISNQTITLSGDVTGSGNISIPITLNTISGLVTGAGTSQTYNNITVSNKGLITSIRLLLAADIPTIANTQVSSLGTMSTQNATAVNISGGTIANVVINGGTF